MITTTRKHTTLRHAAALALLAAALGTGRAHATATAAGTILTNIVSATLWDGPLSGNYYEVSYNSSAYVPIVGQPRIELLKSVCSPDSLSGPPQVVSGQTVIFCICVKNGGTVSVWNIQLTDRLPSYMEFISATASWAAGSGNYNMSTPPPPVPVMAYGAAPGPAMTPGIPASGSIAPLYLRWTFNYVGPGTVVFPKSACVTFSARIL